MGVDESIFKFLFKKFTKNDETVNQANCLATYSHRLEILASALANTRIEVVGHLGPAFLSGSTLYLPQELTKVESPFRQYLWQAISALEWINLAPSTDLLTSLMTNYPAHVAEILSFSTVLAGPPRNAIMETTKAVASSTPAVSKQQNSSVKTQKRPKSVELKDEDENPLVHTFEKTHSIDDYTGGQKRADGDDEMGEHSEALDEVTLSTVTRSGEPANSSIDAEAWLETGPQPQAVDINQDRVLLYPEWSYRHRKYLKNWCRLHVQPVPTSLSISSLDGPTKDATELKRLIESFRNRMRWQRRRPDGAELDLNAFVDVKADLMSKVTPSSHFYMRKQKAEKDVAFSLLLDRSLSTDTYIQGVRVMDLLKSCLNQITYALGNSDTPFSIAAYRSESRHNCYFDIIKTFAEDWSTVPARIHGLEPSGYTRVGPALRHATMELSRQQARKKVIVVLTDLKPTDYDFYEGPYGLLDVRKAVQESQSQGIFAFGLIVNQKRMMGGRHGIFPAGSFCYVRNESEVLKGLEKVFIRAWS